MPDDLFPDAHQLSSKLAWLERHGLTITQGVSGTFYCRMDEENFGTGESAEAACVDFCMKTRMPHWNQET